MARNATAPKFNEANGLYFRSLGWRVDDDGKRSQPKFYLGREQTAAIIRQVRLESLWRLVEANHDADLGDFASTSEEPAWYDETTLLIARAIAKGEIAVKLPYPIELEQPKEQSQWLGRLAGRYPASVTGVELHAAWETNQVLGYGQTAVEALRLKVQADKVLSSAYLPGVRAKSGETLHSALRVYAKYLKEEKHVVANDDGSQRTTDNGKNEGERVERLIRYSADIPLLQFDATTVERMILFWASRPASTATQKPFSISVCDQQCRMTKSFVRWLNRSRFDWRTPPELDLRDIRPRFTALESEWENEGLLDDEQVETYTVAELQTIYAKATPFVRACMTICLNCGFAEAELTTLTMKQIKLRTAHPKAELLKIESTPDDSWIARLRKKRMQPGQWKLWPETVAAIEYLQAERQNIADRLKIEAPPQLVITRTGFAYSKPTNKGNRRQAFVRHWERLIDEIKETSPNFKQLSFKYLRKTSGNFVKLHSDGETMRVFHARKTTNSDKHADVYANRLYARVFKATDEFRTDLAMMFAAVQNPYGMTSKVELVKGLASEGKTPKQISNELEMHLSSVYRFLRS